MARWLDKRIPAAREFTLDLRSIFIFPSRFGLLYLIICLCLFLLGTNYQNNLMLFLCYFLLSLFLLSLFQAYLNFSRLHIQLGKTQNVYAGDEVQLPLWLSTANDHKQKVQGIIHVGFWRQAPAQSVDLDRGGNPHHLTLHCPERGPLDLPRVTLNSYYPLGLFRCWTHLKFAQSVLIYPKPLTCPVQLKLIHSDEQQGNSQAASGHDDFDSLRPCRQGEPLHHVAWKQYAKGQGMLLKEFSSDLASTGWLTLLPVSADKVEQRLGQLCFQVIELARRGDTFGLNLGSSIIEPGSGPAHQERCLEALARFEWRAEQVQ